MKKLIFIGISIIVLVITACNNPFLPQAKEKGSSECSHQYNEWPTKIDATCTEKEVQKRICSLCDDIQTREIGDPLGHTHGDEATCITNQVCTVCDELITQAHGVHTFDTIPATCTADSIPGTCTREGCDEENPEAVVPAFGHSHGVAATCTADQVCIVCEEVLIAAHGHDIRWVITTHPVFPSMPGVETGNCTRCEYIEDETRPYPIRAIGDTGPGGGIIFFVADGVGFLAGNTTPKPLGFTLFTTAVDTVGTTAYYLEAATEPTLGGTGVQAAMRWSIRTGSPYPTVNIANDASGWAIGTGRRNTAIIKTAEEAERPDGNTYIYAVLACDNYSTVTADDWFLPSRDELNELYKERARFSISSVYFWSSSQNDFNRAWVQDFDDGFQGVTTKVFDASVRAVRAF